MKIRLAFLVLSALILGAFLMYSRSYRKYYELSASLYAMNGVEIQIKGYEVSQRDFKGAVAELKSHFQVLEDRLSRFRPGSEVSQINRSKVSVTVHPSTFRLMETAKRVSEASEGAFDITCLPLIQLWKKAAKEKRLPTKEALEAVKAKGNDRDLVLDSRTCGVRIREGMGIDLGGIAQGLFADEGAEILQKHGIRRGLVNCSGEIAVYDQRKNPEPFSIAIYNPHTRKNDRQITLRSGAVSTSGNYERFNEIEGKKYSHIIDPVSGWPASETASVTVQASCALEADAWSTACAVLAARGVDPAKYLPKGCLLVSCIKENSGRTAGSNTGQP